ncbi:MAG: zinc ribbon domain-containing protein [Polyangiales bacterium]
MGRPKGGCTVEEELEALAQLAQIDAELKDLNAERTALPEQMRGWQDDLGRLQALLTQEIEQVRGAETLQQEQQQALQATIDSLAKAKAKSAQARVAREAEAAEREVQAFRRSLKEREEELATLNTAMEEVRGRLDKHQGELETLRQMVVEDHDKAEARLEELAATAAQVDERRQAVAARLPAGLFRRYERIREKRGSGTATPQNGVCSACRMALAPQILVLFERREEVQACPHCLRLLVPARAQDVAPQSD